MIEFDEEKRRKNKAKHGIDLADAVRFDFDTANEIDVTDMREDGEERMMATGWLDERLCTIIYTERGAARRVISLRRASRQEMQDYADHET